MNNKTSIDDLKIVDATAADAAEAAAFIKKLAAYMKVSETTKLTDEKMYELLRTGAGRGIFGIVDGKRVAFLYYYENAPVLLGEKGLYLDALYIEEAYRSSGIGSQMIRHMGRLAAAEGYKRLEWACLDWNERALELYERLGAKTMDTIKLLRAAPEEVAASEAAEGLK